MTKKFMKSVQEYANNVELNHSTLIDMVVEHEDEILSVLNMTAKSTVREDRRARKRKAKEHDLEIVFFGKKVKK
mgnify:CR=1 FL=1